MKLPTKLPVLRNMDAGAYYKEDAGKQLIGGFETRAKPWGMDGIPEDFCFDELPEDLVHFIPIIAGARRSGCLINPAWPSFWFRGRMRWPIGNISAPPIWM